MTQKFDLASSELMNKNVKKFVLKKVFGISCDDESRLKCSGDIAS